MKPSPLAFPARSTAERSRDWAAALERSRAINALPSAYARPEGAVSMASTAQWHDYPEGSK